MPPREKKEKKEKKPKRERKPKETKEPKAQKVEATESVKSKRSRPRKASNSPQRKTKEVVQDSETNRNLVPHTEKPKKPAFYNLEEEDVLNATPFKKSQNFHAELRKSNYERRDKADPVQENRADSRDPLPTEQ